MNDNKTKTGAETRPLEALVMPPCNEVLNMDCMQGMKTYPDNFFDIAIVDPPYGNGKSHDVMNKGNTKTHKAKRIVRKQYDNSKPPDKKYFNELKRVSKNWIVWGANYFNLTGGVIVWDKNGTAFGEGEIAICSTHKSVRFFEFTWNGMLQENMKNKEKRIHVHQKPVSLYDWIIKNYADGCETILDTHVGSGSSRIAAHKAGKSFVGFEIDKDYWKAQEKRYKEFKSQLTLFNPAV